MTYEIEMLALYSHSHASSVLLLFLGLTVPVLTSEVLQHPTHRLFADINGGSEIFFLVLVN